MINRILTIVNLCGVIGLAVLCGLQWQTNSKLDTEVDRLDRIRDQQKTKIDAQAKTLVDNAGELDDLRGRLATAQSTIKADEDKLGQASRDTAQLTSQRDQLKGVIDQWSGAVAARDVLLKKQGDEIKQLSADRRDAQQRLNDLTIKYNASVKP